jgi:tetratricopeptide (TPR) repeat protein
MYDKKLKKQQNDPEIQKLCLLLRSVPAATKTPQEWQVLENSIIARLEADEHSVYRPVFITRLNTFFASIQKQAVLAVVVTGTILVTSVSVFFTGAMVKNALPDAGIVGVTGNAHYTLPDGTITPLSPDVSAKVSNAASSFLCKNQVFETQQNATLSIRLDKGTCILLSENTKLTINQATTRDIELFLHQGNILASVSKRHANQSFSIVTPGALCKVIGTIFNVSVSSDNQGKNVTDLVVLEGRVAIAEQSHPGQSVFAVPGKAISVKNATIDSMSIVDSPFATERNLLLIQRSVEMSTDSLKKTGLIDISSTPSGATVFIQGVNVGTTPLVTCYPAGDYTVLLKHPSYTIWENHLTVRPLNTTIISAPLSALYPPSSSSILETKQCPKVSRNSIAKRNRERCIEERNPLTKDFGYITDPSFVEALVQMTSGEYQKALIILDSLKNLPDLSITDKIRIMSKIAACYKGMGNFEQKCDALTKKYQASENTTEKSNLLWEIITVKANCLEDYNGAEQDILTYIKTYHDGPWFESAYAKLGEIQYITGKYSKAIGTFKYHINVSKSGKAKEKSIYTLANILRNDVKDYKEAIVWYTTLISEHPQSDYFGNTLVERADCYEKEKLNGKARLDYQAYLERFPQGHLRLLCNGRLSLLN